jgi:hypothetical protein
MPPNFVSDESDAMINKLALTLLLTVVLSVDARAQIVLGVGAFDLTAHDLDYQEFTLPVFRVSAGHPRIPVIVGVEYGTTHLYKKPWYGDDMLSTLGISVSAKIYSRFGLEVSMHETDESHFIENDGLYEYKYGPLTTYSVSFLLFTKEGMSNVSLGFGSHGAIRFGANVQVFGEDEWNWIKAQASK